MAASVFSFSKAEIELWARKRLPALHQLTMRPRMCDLLLFQSPEQVRTVVEPLARFLLDFLAAPIDESVGGVSTEKNHLGISPRT